MKAHAMHLVAVCTIAFSAVSLWAQAPAAAPAASQGSATIENQIITYDILRQMAVEIAKRVKKYPSCKSVLLPDPNSESEVITAKAFDVSVKGLVDAYNALAGKNGVQANAQALAAPTLSDIASLFTAIKSSAVYTNQNFQPTTQSMVTLLSIALNDTNGSSQQVAVRTTNLPGNLSDGVTAALEKIGEVESAQKNAMQGVQPGSPGAAALATLDAEFSAFRTSLAGTSPDGTVLATIIKGKALLLPDPSCLLTVSVDAAGGDTKVTHLFWQELIMPTPSPSYNGGAVVSFLLTDQNSNFLDGGISSFMNGWSKWSSPKFKCNLKVKFSKDCDPKTPQPCPCGGNSEEKGK